MLATEKETIQGRLMARDEELEDVRCQFTSINNALEVVTPLFIASVSPFEIFTLQLKGMFSFICPAQVALW